MFNIIHDQGNPDQNHNEILPHTSQNACIQSQSLIHVQLFATPWTVAHQAPLSTGLFRQEYWSGLSFSSPGDLTNPGIEPAFPALQADSLLTEPPGKPMNVQINEFA